MTAQRVLVVSSELPPGPGGIGTHAFAVACGLHDMGRDVRLLGCQHYVEPEERDRFARESPVPIDALPDAADPVRTASARARVIHRTLRRFRPDVVVASGGRLLWSVAPIARALRVPMVSVAHGTELGWTGPRAAATRTAFNSSVSVVAVSEFTAGLLRQLGVRTPIDVIPNGADATRFHPDAERAARFRDRHGLGDRPVILTVGNVTERKGQHLVVDALPAVRRVVPDATYVVVGRPTAADQLLERARRLGVESAVRVLGQVEADEVVSAHAAADVFAMTSTTTGDGDVEGYGIAVVEAALSGVPAVVTVGTGAQEAIIDGRSGLAVTPDAVAEALITLLTDAGMRARMGAAAERDARSAGSWPHRVARYAEVLDRAVTPRPGPSDRPRIVVVSHTEHWRSPDGSIVGFGATTRELDQLATLASELVHIAPLHDGPPPGMALPARAPNVRYVPVPPAGGDTNAARVRALAAVPLWMWTIDRELRHADIAHVRCPAGISMAALLVLLVRRRPRDRWVKYAGNWSPPERDAATYRLQRWWLRRGLARASVTVNGRWPDQPGWIHTFDNPTLTDAEIVAGREAALRKSARPPWRVVFSGRLDSSKGADVAVDTVLALRRGGLDVSLDLIGDGPLRTWVEERMAADGDGCLRLHGWLRRDELERYLSDAHVLLLPTASEGFPKVVAEAMAFGCVPVTTPVGSLGQTLGETGGSVLVESGGSWAEATSSVLSSRWDGLSRTVVDQVGRFGYRTYLDHVTAMASTDWGRELRPRPEAGSGPA